MFVFALVMTLSQPTSLDKVPVEARVATVQVAQAEKKTTPAPEGPGFMEQYFPFGVADSAPQVVQDGFLLSQVLGILLVSVAGGLWGPLLAVKGADLSGDTLVSFLIPWATTVGLVVGCWTGSIVAAFALAAVSGGIGGCFGLCALAAIPIALAGGYVSTNATLNGIARNTFGANTGGAKVTPKLTTKPSAPNGGGSGGPASPSYAY
jgi:hypothetical protein